MASATARCFQFCGDLASIVFFAYFLHQPFFLINAFSSVVVVVVVVVGGMTSSVQTELSGAHSVLELQLQLLSSIEDQNLYANDSADAACQPDTLEELWLQMNQRGMRDEDRRN